MSVMANPLRRVHRACGPQKALSSGAHARCGPEGVDSPVCDDLRVVPGIKDRVLGRFWIDDDGRDGEGPSEASVVSSASTWAEKAESPDGARTSSRDHVVVGDVVSIARRQSDDDRRCAGGRMWPVSRTSEKWLPITELLLPLMRRSPYRSSRPLSTPWKGVQGSRSRRKWFAAMRFSELFAGQDHHSRVERVQAVVGELERVTPSRWTLLAPRGNTLFAVIRSPPWFSA